MQQFSFKALPPSTLSLSAPNGGMFQEVNTLHSLLVSESLAVCHVFLDDLGETSPPAGDQLQPFWTDTN